MTPQIRGMIRNLLHKTFSVKFMGICIIHTYELTEESQDKGRGAVLPVINIDYSTPLASPAAMAG